ncbi:reprolysin-like metallopeptidase [Moheibacter sediminis]|uniref:Por secretion system C-terminal sorting domain-containing protein n=1 Tax=Moheibacter sediminis TaxID=1434700 RepID=A0A1W1Z270_9FLAO|nr:zinc-dependent metalloprotease family protein [Moheibacter sediminis]SMC42577.1 Por secretion system C-terminal sorting domain-containing protein [Moheibacter sediminis]
MKQKFLLLSSCFLMFTGITFAQQNSWTKFHGKNIENPRERTNTPTEYQLVKLNTEQISQQLSSAPAKSQNTAAGINVKFPNAEGTFDTYKVVESSTMHPDLQAKYPEIKSYTGYKIDDPSTKIKFSVSPYFGLNAVIRSTSGLKYIDSYSKDNQVYMVYNRANADHQHTFECKHDGSDIYNTDVPIDIDLGENTVIDGQMRKYRLALATTIEYTAYIAQQAGVGSGTDAEKKAAVMEALNLAVTRLNEVYENEVSVQLEIVPNNDLLIFITTDSYNPLDAESMLPVNQTVVDGAIGSANYDIGHVFFRATAGNDNGIAMRPSVCNNNFKAQGVTGAGNPVGDTFVIDFVAHEMGHQFGANHTQNNACNRNGGTAIEPGSASTIMGYAGICHPNVQGNSDAYFHAVSVREMYNYITAGGNCGANTATGNNEPTVNAGADRTIPKETPFVLTGIATDPDGDLLTYNWEQIDPQTATMPPRPTNTGGPMFRSLWATESAERYFPRLSTLIAGYNPDVITPGNFRAWEKLPAVARNMNFSLLVRDNNPAGGQTGRDDIRLTVTADAGPFIVTSQNSSGQVWNLGESQTITWDVANTNVAPVNTANVTILVSTDGGLTFPHTLVESTPNNGSYTFNVPNGLGTSTTARLMIKAIDNVFLNVNSTHFAINSNMSVDDVNKADALTIYPNPSTGVFTIELDSKSNNISYSVYSLEGKLISQNNVNHNGGKFSQKLNLSHLPSGTYLIQVNNGAEKISKKLIIKK